MEETNLDKSGCIGKLFTYCSYDGGFWFRVYGVGLSIQDREKHPALFSERNGYTKVLRIGKWAIRMLST